VKLRLFHHHDGARIAYREAGTGPGLVLLHSAGLTHRELEPVVEHLTHRFRLLLPDLPLHGDSEDRPRYPYSPAWFAEVLSAFCWETCGPRPLVGGHDLGAEVLLHAVTTRRMTPERLVLLPNRLDGPATDDRSSTAWRIATRAGGLPGLDRLLSHGARLRHRPETGMRLTARGNPGARDLVRHAYADVGGNANLARSWARFARRWPADAWPALRADLPLLDLPTLLLWADEDRRHPLETAESVLDLLPQGQLRVLPGTGYLLAYDDPVGVARELLAFCG
jgi:pimeloyl-ACP methyl ester carboxylesterase